MKKVFRLFISSTFDDFKLERAVLQRFVFPEIKKFLNEKELSFIPIDLRWGVPQEAQEDQKTMEICLNEVDRSAEELHPDFLIMVGNRYGWVPLPEKIEENEFKEIEKFIENKELLNKWYKLDRNQIPSSYILEPVYEVIDKPTQKERLDIWYKESEKLSQGIKSILDENNTNLKKEQNEINISEEQKKKYHLSATHQEYLYYKKRSIEKNINPQENIIGYIREITPSKFTKEELIKAKYFEDLKEKELKNYNEFKKEVSNLPNHYIQKIKDDEILKKEKDNLTTILTEEDIANLKNFEELPEYLKNFANEIKNKIFARIEKELNKEEKSINFQEYYKNQVLKDALINDELIGRSKDIENINKLLKTNNKIIISAESGTGKSAVIAKLIDELQKENVDLIYRFCGVGEIRSVEELLKDILLNEFSDKLDNEFKELLTKKEDLTQLNQEENNKKLEEIKYKFLELTKDKLIILDAIDQLEDKEDELDWLPQKFIISVLNDKNYEEDSRYYRILKTFPQIKEYKLKPIEKKEDIKKIIEQKLEKYSRTLTDNQFEYVLSRKDSKKPLYLTIALQELKTWRDDENNPNYNPQNKNSKAKLSNTQQALIKEFIQNLYTIHRNDELLVKRTFGYIYASQNHLDEELLLEVLSNDEDVMKRVSNEWHLNITGKLPDAVWARLRGEIINFLKEDKQGNIQFFHREFQKVSEDKRLKIYSQKVGAKLLNILEKLPPTPKVLEAHAHTLALLKMNDEDFEINFEWFDKLKTKELQEYLQILSFSGHYYSKNNQICFEKIYYELLLKLSEYFYENRNYRNIFIDYYLLALNNLGILLLKLNQNQEAKIFLRKQLLLLSDLYEKKRKDEYAVNYAKALTNFSNVLKNDGYFGIVKKNLLKAEKIKEKLFMNNPEKFVETYTITLNDLGNLYLENNDFESAEKYYLKVKEIREKFFEKNRKDCIEGYTTILNNLGGLYKAVGNYDEALKYYFKAMRLREEQYNINSTKWKYLYVLSLISLARIYKEKGVFGESKKLLQKAIKIMKNEYKENFFKWGEYYSTAYNLLSFVDKNNALKYLKKTLTIREKLYKSNKKNRKFVQMYWQSLNNLALYFSNLGQYNMAEENYLKAKDFIEKFYKKDSDLWYTEYSQALANLAGFYFKNRNINEAISLFEEVVIILKNRNLDKNLEKILMAANNFLEMFGVNVYNDFSELFYNNEVNNIDSNIDFIVNFISENIYNEIKRYNISGLSKKQLLLLVLTYFRDNNLPEELIEPVLQKLLEIFKG